MKRILCSCLLLLSISVQAQKKPLDHTVYDQWQSIKDVVLSNDGNWMSYTVAPQEGDATLYVRHLKTNQIIKIERGTQSKFTENNAFLIAKIKPTFDETRKAKIGNCDFSKIVARIAEAACSIGELYVSITSHKAYDWFECVWIKHNTRAHQWHVRAIERGSICLARTFVTN